MDISDTATHRSRLLQLLALAFAHPVPELHGLMKRGEFQQALSLAAAGSGISITAPALLEEDFIAFEAAYIDLFEVGDRGRPRLHLHAADYPALLEGNSRPEFLLEHSQWYRHFGLKTAEDSGVEMADHILCQLELLAWLTHLEAQASDQTQRTAYRQAQADFCERHLAPLTRAIAAAMHAAPAFWQTVVKASCAVVETSIAQAPGSSAPGARSRSDENIDAVNLWE